VWFSSKINSIITSLKINGCPKSPRFTKADGEKYEKNFRKSFELSLQLLSLYSLTEYIKILTQESALQDENFQFFSAAIL
jgi:hypothetical protein